MRKEIMYRNKEERIAVLKKLGSMGYKWNGGEAVLEYDSSMHDSTGGYISTDDSDKTITYGCKYDWVSITNGIPAEKFLGEAKKRKPIVISMKGRKVTAEDKATGKTASAICGYGDEFNFKTGAAIALARLMDSDDVTDDVKAEWYKLFGEESKTEADTDEIKVGDRVVIKAWDEMARDYEAGEYSIRHNEQSFTDGMRNLCGRTATVTAKKHYPHPDEIELDFDNKSGTSTWSYSEWMVKKIDDSKSDEIKVGDMVSVIESGYSYPNYANWFIDNNIDKDIAIRYAYGSEPYVGRLYYVKAIAEHKDGHDIIYCIQENKENDGLNPAYLISREGIEKYEG